MKLRVSKWLIIASAALLALLMVAWMAVVRVLSGPPQEIAHEVLLTAFVLRIEGQVIPAQIEQAFFASSHGGWHGDGTDVTAYRVAGKDVAMLSEALKEKTPGFVWDKRFARAATIADLYRLMPETFRPHPDEHLRHGQQESGLPLTEYYIDTRRATLYVVTNTF